MRRGRGRPTAGPHRSASDTGRALAAAIEWQKAGDLKRAGAAYRRILAQQPDQPDALHLLGVVALQSGRPEEAADLIGRAIRIKADSAVFHNNLGNALCSLGQPDAAIASYRRAIRLDPRYLTALANLGSALQAEDALDDAANAYRRALQIDPRNVGVLCNLGTALHEQGRLDEAIAHFRQALAINPAFAGAWFNLGNALTDQGQFDQAISCYRRTLEIEPRDAKAHDRLGTAFRDCGKLGDAIECFRRAVECDPDYAKAHNNLGFTLQALGRFDEARASYEQAIATEPGLAMAYVNHAYITKADRNDTKIARMVDLLREKQLSTPDRWALNFALGKCFDDQGAYDDAFAHYRAANELKGGAAAFDPLDWEQNVGQIMATFSRQFFADRAGLGNDSERPLFVLGMPRSGTSLTEQILSAHPEVFGAGELNDFYFMVGKLPEILGSDLPYPACAELIEGAIVERLARDYLDHLHEVAPKAKRVVDKMPNNFLRLGLIALLFPRARVIHCRRDPVDVCLSCYFQNFKAQHSYSHDLGNLGLYYRQYERLMAHWRAVLSLPMIEVSYEKLTGNPEGAAREMIGFCDLEWDDRCLTHHERDHPIMTASVWQARQPVYRTSVQRWKRYDKHLGPLLRALEAAPAAGGDR